MRGGLRSSWSITGAGTPSHISQPNSVISADSSGEAFCYVSFHDITSRLACRTCRNRIVDVGGRVLILGLFFFLVNGMKRVDYGRIDVPGGTPYGVVTL